MFRTFMTVSVLLMVACTSNGSNDTGAADSTAVTIDTVAVSADTTQSIVADSAK